MLKDIISSLSFSIKGTIKFLIRSVLLVFFVFILWAIAVSFFTKASYLFVPAFLAITTVCGMIIYRYFKAEAEKIIQVFNRIKTRRNPNFNIPSETTEQYIDQQEYGVFTNKEENKVVTNEEAINEEQTINEKATNIINGFVSSYITKNVLTPIENLLSFLTKNDDKVRDLQFLIHKETGVHIPIDQLESNITLQFHALNYEAFKDKIHANIPDIEPGSTEAEIINIYALTYYDIFGEIDNYDTYMDNLLCEISTNNFIPIKTLKQEIRVEQMKNKLNDPNFSLRDYYTIDDIDNMDGYTFEDFVASLLKNMGFLCESKLYSRDQGADVIAEKFGERTAVQCKRYADKVGNKAVQEVVASLKYHNCDKGLVITNNYLTEPAKELAKANAIEYWERDKLAKLLDNYPVSKKVLQRE